MSFRFPDNYYASEKDCANPDLRTTRNDIVTEQIDSRGMVSCYKLKYWTYHISKESGRTPEQRTIGSYRYEATAE